MKNKLLSVIFCLLALVLLVGCENKTEPTKKRVNYESSQTQNGGNQTNPTQGGEGSTTQGGGQQVTTTTQGGGQATTTSSQSELVVTLTSSEFGAAATAQITDYVESNLTKEGIGFYAHSIVRNGYLQVGLAKASSNRKASVIMNTTAKKVVKIEITVDSANQNFDGKILVFGFNEAIANNEAFAAKGLTPLTTIALASGTTTYTYEFTGDYNFFAISPSDRFLALAQLKVTFA